MASLITVRTRRAGLVGALALAGSLLVGPSSVALAGTVDPTACVVTDVTASTAPFSSLQGAVDAATAGDTLRVMGTCTGSTRIDKDLYIRGIWTATSLKPTLDGGGLGSVLVTLAVIKIKGLVIRNGGASGVPGSGPGHFQRGGGVDNLGTLKLVNVKVRNNRADIGAGIFNQGTLKLFGRTSIDHNSSLGRGGGIEGFGVTEMSNSSSIHHNSALWGAGIYLDPAGTRGTLTMADSSSIHDNTAGEHGGGVYYECGAVLTGVDGSNVHNNTPDDIYTPPTSSITAGLCF